METKYIFDENPYLRLYQLYRRTGAAIHRARRKELRKYRLSDSETAILAMVHASKNMITPSGVAKQTIQDNHATAQLIVRMEKRGLLKKVKDLPRPNMVRVVLTDLGEQAYQKTRDFRSVEAIFSELNEEERRQFAAYLSKIWNKAAELGE